MATSPSTYVAHGFVSVCLLMEAKAGVYHKLLFIFIFMAMWLGMYGACRTYMYLEISLSTNYVRQTLSCFTKSSELKGALERAFNTLA